MVQNGLRLNTLPISNYRAEKAMELVLSIEPSLALLSHFNALPD